MPGKEMELLRPGKGRETTGQYGLIKGALGWSQDLRFPESCTVTSRLEPGAWRGCFLSVGITWFTFVIFSYLAPNTQHHS